MNSQLLISTPNDGRQYAAFEILTLAVAGLTGILYKSLGTITKPYLGMIPLNPVGFFQPFVGSINPTLMIALVAVEGFVSLGFLYSRGWFEIYSNKGHYPSAHGYERSAVVVLVVLPCYRLRCKSLVPCTPACAVIFGSRHALQEIKYQSPRLVVHFHRCVSGTA